LAIACIVALVPVDAAIGEAPDVASDPRFADIARGLSTTEAVDVPAIVSPASVERPAFPTGEPDASAVAEKVRETERSAVFPVPPERPTPSQDESEVVNATHDSLVSKSRVDYGSQTKCLGRAAASRRPEIDV
jgi:hypothetical protein